MTNLDSVKNGVVYLAGMRGFLCPARLERYPGKAVRQGSPGQGHIYGTTLRPTMEMGTVRPCEYSLHAGPS